MTATPEKNEDDRMTFWLRAEYSLAHEPVRLKLPLALALTASHDAQGDHPAVLQKALHKLLPVKWALMSLREEYSSTSRKSLRCMANASVDRQDIHHIQMRIKKATQKGLELGEPDIDFSIPHARLQEILRQLRAEILRELMVELQEINKSTNRKWRIGFVDFDCNFPGNMAESKKITGGLDGVAVSARIVLRSTLKERK